MRKTDRALPIALLLAREATLRPFRAELDAIGLTVQQWRVIRVLAEGVPRTAGELSERCVLMPPSLSRILKTLAERGLIERVGADDARLRMFAITPEGMAQFDAMGPKAEAIYARFEEKLGPGKMDLLLDLLSELREVAERS